MSDDLDPNLVRTIGNDKESREYQAKYILDEATFMLFDLERGGFLNYHGETIQVDDVFKVSYKRVPVSEEIVNGWRNIVSNFFIEATYNDKVVLDYIVYGAEKKFTIKTLEGFHASMFLNVLDSYRKKKFGITE